MVKIKLVYPVEFDGKTYSEIEVPRPKMKHLKGMSATPTIDDLMLVAIKVTGLPKQVIDDLDASDGLRLSEVLGDFLSAGRETGKS